MSSAAHCFYTACGLSIGADGPVAGLRHTTTQLRPDIMISLRGDLELGRRPGTRDEFYVSPETDARGRPEMAIETDDRGYWLTYNDEATFLVDPAGSHIVARWTTALGDAGAASHLAGSVLAFVLRLRGSVPVHASGIVVDEQAILFLGDPWAGKSTTVAAFTRLGFPLLADDIVRIHVDGSRRLAYPGQPRLHLWTDAAAALFGPSFRAHDTEYGKHTLDLAAGGRAHTAPLPVGAIYVLQERLPPGSRGPSIEPMPASAALVALVRHTYGGCLLDRAMRAREFDVLCRLLDSVPVRQLMFGDDLAELPAGCEVLAALHRQ